MTECPACHRQHDADTQPCPTCVARTRINLRSIADNYHASADPTLTPRGEPGPRNTTNRPLPGGTGWLSFRHAADILGPLRDWADDWAERYRLTVPRPDLSALTAWLSNNLNTAAVSHPAIADFVREVAEITHTADRYAGLAPEPRSRIQCPAAVDDGDTCGARLTLAADRETTCPRCGTEWTTVRLVRLIWDDPADDDTVPLDLAAWLAGVDRSTITRWAKAGHITRTAGRYNLASIRTHIDNRETA